MARRVRSVPESSGHVWGPRLGEMACALVSWGLDWRTVLAFSLVNVFRRHLDFAVPARSPCGPRATGFVPPRPTGAPAHFARRYAVRTVE